MKTHVQVGRDFSPVPAGRYKEDGPFSGETFRKRYLIDPIKQKIEIVIDLSGTDGYGSSFLEEAFGGMVRELKLKPEEIKKYLKIVASDARFRSYVSEAYLYLDEAAKDLSNKR